MKKQIGFLACVLGLCVASEAMAQAARQPVSGRAPILWDRPQHIQLVPDVKIYPGVTIEIATSGTVDVDHVYWEERRCKWAGLKCWYEDRDRPNWMRASELEVQFAIDNGTVSNGAAPHKLELSLLPDNSNFTEGSRLAAMIWKPGRNAPASRAPCIGRPRNCSAGDLTLTFAVVNVGPRLAALEQFLVAQRIETLDPGAITATNFIDPLLFDPAAAPDTTLTRLGRILTAAIGKYRSQIKDLGQVTPALHMKVIDLATYTLKLAPLDAEDAANLRITITESYLDRGDYAQATKEAPTMMRDAAKLYETSKTGANALVFARALKANAAAWREKQARNSSADIRVSIALLDQAAELLWQYTDIKGVSAVLSDIYVDAARMLNLLRTVAELQAAEARLVRAMCFQLHAEKSAGNTFVSWQAGLTDPAWVECRTVLKP